MTTVPPAFDYEELERPNSLTERIFERILSYPQRLIAFLRYLRPVVHLPFTKIYLALRYDQVREVLFHDREFVVPWDGKMREITRGRNFVLGMERDAVYKKCYAELAKAFPLEDVPTHVSRPAAAFSEEIIDRVAKTRNGRFDAVEELVTTLPAKLCETYYGIDIGDPVHFAKWSLAVSADVFGAYDKEQSPLARAGASNLDATIRKSIRAAQAGNGKGPVMRRFVESGLDEDAIYAHFLGMVMGFIPTNVLGGGNILETLLRRPDFLETTRSAALADDDELLWRCLREALRFRHINPTPLRKCPGGYTFDVGGPDEKRIPPGATVIAMIQSATMDSRRLERPHVFDPDRREEDYMTFSVGQHWCLGAYIAKAQITQTLKPLLKRKGLRAVDNPGVLTKRFHGLFPLHLVVEFDP